MDLLCNCSHYCVSTEEFLEQAPCPPATFYDGFAKHALDNGLYIAEVCKIAEKCMNRFPTNDSAQIIQNICSTSSPPLISIMKTCLSPAISLSSTATTTLTNPSTTMTTMQATTFTVVCLILLGLLGLLLTVSFIFAIICRKAIIRLLRRCGQKNVKKHHFRHKVIAFGKKKGFDTKAEHFSGISTTSTTFETESYGTSYVQELSMLDEVCAVVEDIPAENKNSNGKSMILHRKDKDVTAKTKTDDAEIEEGHGSLRSVGKRSGKKEITETDLGDEMSSIQIVSDQTEDNVVKILDKSAQEKPNAYLESIDNAEKTDATSDNEECHEDFKATGDNGNKRLTDISPIEMKTSENKVSITDN